MKFREAGLVLGAALMLAGCGGGSGESEPKEMDPMGLILTGNTTTVAGDGTAGEMDSTDGTGATAQFNFPRGLTTDGTSLYVSESSGDRIRTVNPTTGETTTLAGGVGVFQDSTDGTGATAGFVEPRQLTYVGGFLYTCDYGANRIRKTDVATGNTTTLAGQATAGTQDSTDATGVTAQFDGPTGITTDGTNLYVCDAENHRIRRVVIATGETTTLAGTGASINAESTDGTGLTASFNRPQAIAYFDGRLFVSTIVRIVEVHATTGNTTFLAGTDGPPAHQDSLDGLGSTARFSLMLGISTDGVALFVGDTNNHRMRVVQIATGNTTTLAGDGPAAPPSTPTPPAVPFQDSTDGTGGTARFNRPRASVILNGVLYVSDGANHRVRKIE